jgi:hypothetical protein
VFILGLNLTASLVQKYFPKIDAVYYLEELHFVDLFLAYQQEGNAT